MGSWAKRPLAVRRLGGVTEDRRGGCLWPSARLPESRRRYAARDSHWLHMPAVAIPEERLWSEWSMCLAHLAATQHSCRLCRRTLRAGRNTGRRPRRPVVVARRLSRLRQPCGLPRPGGHRRCPPGKITDENPGIPVQRAGPRDARHVAHEAEDLVRRHGSDLDCSHVFSSSGDDAAGATPPFMVTAPSASTSNAA
jgi:hypothetical protein